MTTHGQTPRILSVTLEFVPKTYDIDASNHVSNISYIRWLEDLRLAWLDCYHPLKHEASSGVMPALLRTEIDYVRQIRLFEKVTGAMWVAPGGRLRFALHAEFTVDGELRARATQIGIWFRVEDSKPVRPPDELLRKIEEAANNNDLSGGGEG
ncbi:MAG: thioesterase family protein [bacterium]